MTKCSSWVNCPFKKTISTNKSVENLIFFLHYKMTFISQIGWLIVWTSWHSNIKLNVMFPRCAAVNVGDEIHPCKLTRASSQGPDLTPQKTLNIYTRPATLLLYPFGAGDNGRAWYFVFEYEHWVQGCMTDVLALVYVLGRLPW